MNTYFSRLVSFVLLLILVIIMLIKSIRFIVSYFKRQKKLNLIISEQKEEIKKLKKLSFDNLEILEKELETVKKKSKESINIVTKQANELQKSVDESIKTVNDTINIAASLNEKLSIFMDYKYNNEEDAVEIIERIKTVLDVDVYTMKLYVDNLKKEKELRQQLIRRNINKEDLYNEQDF